MEISVQLGQNIVFHLLQQKIKIRKENEINI